MSVDITNYFLLFIAVCVLTIVYRFCNDHCKDHKFKQELNKLERKIDTLWQERQKLRCDNKIHIQEDWETTEPYNSNLPPYIRCKHCRKTPRELGVS